MLLASPGLTSLHRYVDDLEENLEIHPRVSRKYTLSDARHVELELERHPPNYTHLLCLTLY